MNETKAPPIEFSNARRYASVPNWPSGSQRVRAVFVVERNERRGERVVRQTMKPGREQWHRPKMGTYYKRCAIVDGSDGRTYYLAEYALTGSLTVAHCDLRTDHLTVFSDADPGPARDLYARLLGLLDSTTGEYLDQKKGGTT